jgi:hypothetical protein
LKYTSSTRARCYQSAATAGTKSLKKTLNGENHMHRMHLDLNMARSHIGHKVNLHLKDGSVIINVLITNARRNLYEMGFNRSMLHFTTPMKGKISKIPLREIEWMEPLSKYLVC